MKPTSLFSSNTLMVGSLIVLIIVILIFHFQKNPPQISNMFSSIKPAGLEIESEDHPSVNTPFTLSLTIEPQNQPVNAVGLYLKFNPTKLQVLDIDTSQSFCQFYPEKRFDNNLGTVNLVCGAPHPGSVEKTTVLKLEFMPLVVGGTVLSLDPRSQILLSDGKGTNILEGQDITYQINISNRL